MRVTQLCNALETIAPLSYAEPSDNVGLLVGDPDQSVSKILLTIDYSTAVAEEARDLNCDFIVAYHPPIFSPVKRVTANGPTALIHDAIHRGVAIYSPHTAWDAADGGTNDFLASCIKLTNVEPLQFNTPAATVLKLVTFVPEKDLERVSQALFTAGAGHIGQYHSCSFRTNGTGTFFGQPGTQPTVGQPGRLETQPETRLETIVPISKLNAVTRALLCTHPYEEPAYDLTMLASPPTGHGQGRLGILPAPMSAGKLIVNIKQSLGLNAVLFTGDSDRPVSKIAICAGAGGSLLDAAITAGADLFLTGELRHHDAIKAISAGMQLICTLHSNCERPSLKHLSARLEQLLPDCPPIVLSQQDRDPFQIR